MELHLVPDTNLFFEFKALDQLPWAELGHDPVVLLLTKPVLDEIDKHKKAGGRTRDRALDIFGRFRAMLESQANDSEVQPAGPRVLLRRMTMVRPDPDIEEHLDYNRPDERLIGIVSTLSKGARGYQVKLFTDDGGPAGLAQDLGVPFKMIPQAWRRPPAETTEAKQIRDLKKVVEVYQNQEPRVAIRCETEGGDGIVTVAGKTAIPLTETELEELIEALRLKHPPREDFTPPDPTTSTDTWGATKTATYSAPSADDVANYRDRLYPKWLDDCRAALRRVHVGRDEQSPSVKLQWALSNDGSRPAERVRVEFVAEGHVELLRPRPAQDDDEDDTEPNAVSTEPLRRIPTPPKPPEFGKTIATSQPTRTTPSTAVPARGVPLSSLRGMNHALGNFAVPKSAAERLAIGGAFAHPISAEMRRMHDAIKGFSRHDALMRSILNPTVSSMAERVQMPIRHLSPPSFLPPRPPDPEKFHPAAWPAGIPVRTGALTCQLWRHQADEEVFEFDVVFDKEGDARGVIECTVHADNITVPPQKKVVVERKVEAVSMLDVARAMVEACV
ncbi:hypothetical protein [Bradyrhizobium japonicum]|uniref:hypothetical protein n=1 Tax=Bradyrhizobium japonicum TaxID=375 RepID=UPI00209F3EE4|nr:hypothetical protein [Bradyrhizobium japonicum]MCP1760956.1 hypothetical protein [Bradyrhizobium japonicum]MCP1792535.1 hypothetical protein [Bradyrhizobium japonicum]MCP1804970.1 hypothetical protein [Bradyrhizobium japonicum]MCP1813991.1 hypothetical protein [Bradyrhizobium japonicum]MCP1874586.1 hypothetical protein [Bradyrhizobium japonicum]